MKEFYEWVLENTEDRINKINVSIPENDKRVINFAKKVGFKKEGLNRDSYMKNGTIYAQQNLGITRSEIEDYIND
jgi:RimJ/RimL family protein N-acetyltransferase